MSDFIANTDPVRIRLKRLRERTGLSVAATAAEIGWPKSTYASYEDKFKKEFLPMSLVQLLLPVFTRHGIEAEEVRSLGIAADFVASSAEGKRFVVEAKTATRAIPNARPGPTHGLLTDKEIPVYASAEGGTFGMTINYDPIERIPCPAPLVGVRDAFGFYIIGDSMEPKYSSGDLVYVHPRKPARRGNYVLVILKAKDEMGHDALVKRLVSVDSKQIVLEQLNPPMKLDPIPRERVEGLHLIVGSFEGGV